MNNSTIQPLKTGEKITYDKAWGEDGWVCLCGNMPADDGFYPCTRAGTCVEPTPEAWLENLYVCNRCGRIIEQNTLNVVGRIDLEKIQLL